MAASIHDGVYQDTTIDGPFGSAKWTMTLPTARVVEMYRQKCGVDVSSNFQVKNIHLYECERTGMRFWTPADIAGDESFYARLSAAWPTYYKTWRWEYDLAAKYATPGSRVLEIGCGRGYFLRHLQARPVSADSLGLELNKEAIANKVTSLTVLPRTVQEQGRESPNAFNLVCAFQVLEHIVEVESFIAACIQCLAPGGRLLFSTPNPRFTSFANLEDAFDLPPHHVNQFSESAYRKIGNHYGLAVDHLHAEPRSPSLESTTDSTRRSFTYKVARKVSQSMISLAYSHAREPGPSHLVVYRKPT